MPTPTRSWRHRIGRIPAAAVASITGVVGYVLRNSTPSRFMISAIASTIFMRPLLCSRRQAKRLAAELFGDQIPAERGVMRGAVSVAVAALDGLGIEHGARAAGLEQMVDRADAEPRNERLVSAVADAVEIAEAFAARRTVEDLADVLAMQCARRVHFRRGFRQSQLKGDGFHRAA